MIQILGLRDYYSKKHGKTLKAHKFFDLEWRAPSVIAILNNPEKYVEQIPEEERYNMYFTLANCHGERARDFNYQTVMPIDIDNINVEKKEETIQAACDAIGISFNLTGSLFSGNGVQMFIQLDQTIDDVKYFNDNRIFYKAMCKRIKDRLRGLGLPGDLDTSVFDGARLMRMPETMNKKPDRPHRKAYVIQKTIEPQGFDLKVASGIPTPSTLDQVSPESLKKYKLDTDSVLRGCSYLSYCKDNPEKVSEPQWYAMLGILGHLKDGEDLAHEYSKEAPSYDREETAEKLHQAKMASGPRTCDSINALWGGCSNCKFNGKQKSPVLIKDENYIGTKDTGFYDIIIGESGRVSRKPNYDDLLKYFKQKYTYYFIEDTGEVFGYQEGVWEIITVSHIKSFAEKNFSPKPNKAMRGEFVEKVFMYNQKRSKDLEEASDRKVNLQNGVYCMDTDKLLEHSPDFFFRWKLNFEYDAKAECPMFDKFLSQIFEGREDVSKCVKQYFGYCLSGDSAWAHKWMMLIGPGGNGKSVLMEILRGMFAEGSVGGYPLDVLAEKETARFETYSKPLNANEESGVTVTRKYSETLKNMSSGGIVPVRELYNGDKSVRWRAKLLFSMNRKPDFHDNSEGSKRRAIVINCDYKVTPEEKDPKLAEKILKRESAGVFNSLIREYKIALKNESFDVPQSSVDMINGMIESSDTIAQWVNNNVTLTGDYEDIEFSVDLYKNYTSYCDENGIKFRHNRLRFVEELKTYFKDRSLDVSHGRFQGKTTRARGFRGLKIAPPDDAEVIAKDRF